VYNSRNWEMKMFGEDVLFMAPVADLVNTCGEYPTRTKVTPDGEFVMWASEELPAGKEVCFYYGDHCKEENQIMYGFPGEWQRKCKGAQLLPGLDESQLGDEAYLSKSSGDEKYSGE
jgi:hypothetical protein